MDQSQFQAYEVAGATDMNRLHQFPQDYFQEVVEGLIGDNSDALFGTAGFSSSIVAGPLLQIIVNAQTFAAGGRIGSVVPTLSHHASSIPAKTQRFYIYLDIQTTEVTEVRDIANPGTGVKTPTPIVTHKTVAASVVVIEVDQGNPEAPPAIGVIAPGVERLGYIKLGYVDYNEVGATNVDVFNIAGIFTAPGIPNISLVSIAFNDLSDCSGAPGAAGNVPRSDGANLIVGPLSGNDLSEVTGLPGTNKQVLTSDGTNISPQNLPIQIKTTWSTALVDKNVGLGQSLVMTWAAADNPNNSPPERLDWFLHDVTVNRDYRMVWLINVDEATDTYVITVQFVRYDHGLAPHFGHLSIGTTTGSLAWAVPALVLTEGGSTFTVDWVKATRTFTIVLGVGPTYFFGRVVATKQFLKV